MRIEWIWSLSTMILFAPLARADVVSLDMRGPEVRRFRCDVEMLPSEESDDCEVWVVFSGGVSGSRILGREALAQGERRAIDIVLPAEIPANGRLGMWVMPGPNRDGRHDRVRWWGPEFVGVDPDRPAGVTRVATVAQALLAGQGALYSGDRRISVPTGPDDVPLAVFSEEGLVIGAASRSGAGVLVPFPADWVGSGPTVWRGLLHAHSDLSDGAGSPETAFRQARAEGVDFFAVTDHAEMLRIPSFGKGRWPALVEAAKGASAPGAFVALAGFEYTHPMDGHVNVIGAQALIDAVSSPRWTTFLEALSTESEAVGQFNHPDHPGTNNWDDFSVPEGEIRARAVEQMALIRAKDSEGGFGVAYRAALDRGWRVAPQSSHDDHIASWGRGGTSRTGIVAPSLTRSSLLASIRNRLVFASSDSGLSVVLRSGGHWMGEEVPSGPLELQVSAWDLAPDDRIARIAVVGRNGRQLASTVPDRVASERWAVTVDARPGEAIYVHVVQEDGGEALSAPLFVGP